MSASTRILKATLKVAMFQALAGRCADRCCHQPDDRCIKLAGRSLIIRPYQPNQQALIEMVVVKHCRLLDLFWFGMAGPAPPKPIPQGCVAFFTPTAQQYIEATGVAAQKRHATMPENTAPMARRIFAARAAAQESKALHRQ
jgi:hypothetical protein